MSVLPKGSLYSDCCRACCGEGSLRGTFRKICTAMCYRQHISPDLPPEEFEHEDRAGRKKRRCCYCLKSKPIARNSKGKNSHNQEFKAVLTCPELALLAVGMMVGAGIFAMPGKAIVVTGPGLVLSYATASVAVTIVALCYAELAAAIPSTGAAYSYTYHYFGELWAWIVGWSLLLEYVVGSAVESRAWTHYMVAILQKGGAQVPKILYNLEIPNLPAVSFNITAVVLVVILSLIVMWGIKEGSHVNTVMVMAKLGVLVFFVVFALTKFNIKNYEPLTPFGIEGVFKGAAMIYFGFLGFDGACSLAKEVKNPRKSLPAALISSLVIVSVVFTAVVFALCGAVPYQKVNPNEPLLSVSKDVIVQIVISAGAFIASPTVILTETMALSRILHRMSTDSLLPKCLSTLRRHQPVNAVLLAMTAVSLMAFVFDVSTLGSLTSIGASLAFMSVFCALIFRRHISEDDSRADTYKRRRLGWAILLTMGISFLWSLSFYHKWPPILCSVLGGLLILAIVTFSAVSFWVQCKQKTFCAKSKTFKVPLVPLVPLIGMTTTLHIIMGVGWAAISVYAVWISVGLVVYFTYGICLSYQARTYLHKRDESDAKSDADSGVEDTDSVFEEKERRVKDSSQ